MALFYRRFDIVVIMAPIIKLIKKKQRLVWTEECQKAWELIKQKYIEASILISPN
jgi:hypothetical protein